MLGILDANNFFVSCERLFDPSLHGRPVVVLSNNDGAIIARSNEAKALGLKMGQPLFQVKEFLRRHNVIVRSSNYALYGDISRRVMQIVSEEVPECAVYSIDEIFFDLSGMPRDLNAWARRVQNRVLQETGIPSGIGIATTKTLAKLANKLAKKSKKANGVLVLDDPKWLEIALQRTPVDDVWGVGRRYAAKLNEIGVTTARDLRDMPDPMVRQLLKVGGLRTVRELRGERNLTLDDNPAHRESVCVSRSFSSELSDLDTVKEAILSFAGRACKKLRKMNLVACQFQVFLLSNRFKADRPQFTKSIEVGLTPATNDTVIICKTIGERLPKVWQPDMSVKKAGILMMGLCQPEYAPQDLFSQTSLSPSPLMTALDRIESRFGKEAVTVGRAQRARGMDWFMTSENRSPCYTTKWQDIKTIR
tara:strand:+ start:1102 stop:2361 length:1260 start_codon:yes stop_codon:yes gene_type:complete